MIRTRADTVHGGGGGQEGLGDPLLSLDEDRVGVREAG